MAKVRSSFARLAGRVRGILVALLAMSLFTAVAPAQIASASTPIRVFVNGDEIKNFTVQPYEYTPEGRVMVEAATVALSMGCKTVERVDDSGAVRITDNCSDEKTTLTLYPQDKSTRVELVAGFRGEKNARAFQVDAPASMKKGYVIAPARLLADAFNCYSEWDPDSVSFRIDCHRAPVVHQGLEAVMERVPAPLGEHGFTVPTVDGAIPMYPTTFWDYQEQLELANQSLFLLNREPGVTLALSYDGAANRGRIFNAANLRVYAYVYRDGMVTMPGMSTSRVLHFTNAETRRALMIGLNAAMVVLVLTLILRKTGQRKLGVAVLLIGLLVAAVPIAKARLDTRHLERCVAEAHRLALEEGRDLGTASVSVAVRMGKTAVCIPNDVGTENKSWDQYLEGSLIGNR